MPQMSMSADTERLPDEFALIAEIFAPLATDPLAFGLTDDAAIIAPSPGKDLVVTADMLIAGVHFFTDDAADLTARKLLRVNLSDLAAKGATPHAYLLTVALPHNVTITWLRNFAGGLAADQQQFGISLLGGDTTATAGPLTLSVTAMGFVPEGRMLRRAGACAGDGIYVTGSIGDSVLGLAVRRHGAPAGMAREDADFLLERYLLPRPRVAMAPFLAGLAHAAIDISDGLAADLGHVCKASGLGARVMAADVPLSEAAGRALARGATGLVQLFTGGDDYELLLAVTDAAAPELQRRCQLLGVPLTRIGQFTAAGEVIFRDAKGAKLAMDSGGYRHF